MRKFLFVLVVCLALVGRTVAQKSADSIAVVTTTTGETYKGTILENIPNDHIKIKTLGNYLYQLPYNLIRNITYTARTAAPATVNNGMQDNLPAPAAREQNARPANDIYYVQHLKYKRTSGAILTGIGSGLLLGGTIAIGATGHIDTYNYGYTSGVHITGAGVIPGVIMLSAAIPCLIVGIIQLSSSGRHLKRYAETGKR